MAEFLQSYGLWILLGLIFLLMMWGRVRGRGMGGGCCGTGGQQHDHQQDAGDKKKEGQQKPEEQRSGCH